MNHISERLDGNQTLGVSDSYLTFKILTNFSCWPDWRLSFLCETWFEDPVVSIIWLLKLEISAAAGAKFLRFFFYPRLIVLQTNGLSCDGHDVLWQTCCIVTDGLSCDSRAVMWQTRCRVTNGLSCDRYAVVWQTGCLVTNGWSKVDFLVFFAGGKLSRWENDTNWFVQWRTRCHVTDGLFCDERAINVRFPRLIIKIAKRLGFARNPIPFQFSLEEIWVRLNWLSCDGQAVMWQTGCFVTDGL